MSAALVITLMTYFATQVQGKHIFCYYSSFAQTRHGLGNYLPENINANLCTHIIFAFVDITPDGRDLISFNRNDLGPRGLYARTMALKNTNPSLKVLLAVGGWQIGSKPFIPMIQNEDNRRVWIKNVVSYLRKHKFDGFDVDWEFPATRGSPPQDKYRFTKLMKGLFEAFADEAAATGSEKLLLTLATASGTYYIDQSYEPDKIINYIDFMLLMTYNYHGQWEKVTGHHSGLFRHRDDPTTGEKAQLYQQWSIDYWLDVGVPKEKLIVGIPTYGMSFTLADSSDNGVRAPAIGGGRMGDYTRETGILAYYEICLNMRDKGWNSVWIEDQAAPFAQGGNQWVGYENQKSIILKAKNIKLRDLAGAFVWSMEMDDFRGTCGEGQYPLLSAIQDVLNAGSHSNSAAGQPDIHSTPSQDITYSMDKDKPTRHQTTPSLSPKLKIIKTRKLQKPWKKQVFRKFQKVIEPKNVAVASTSQATTTTTDLEMTSGVGQESLQNLWWTNPSARQTKTNKPRKWTSAGPGRRGTWRKRKQFKPAKSLRLSKETHQMSRVAEKIAVSEGHKVKSWQTARWWTGASEAVGRNLDQGHTSTRGTSRSWPALQKNTTTAFYLQTDSTRTASPQKGPTTTASFQIEATTTTLPRIETSTTTTLQVETTSLQETRATPDIDVDTPPSDEVSSAAGAPEVRMCRVLGVGTFADPSSCEHFLICMPGNWLNYPPHVMACPAGTRFDSDLKICNYASRVSCHH